MDYLKIYELYHHGIKGQRWGIRRFQNSDGSLTTEGKLRYSGKHKEADKLANDVYNKAASVEPKITSDLQSIVNNTTAKLYGLEHRLKTKESISRKIFTDAEEKSISLEEASKIKDAVRYTALSNNNDFTSNYFKIKQLFEDKGYSEIRCKNYFDLYNQGKVKHKSVQSVFNTPDGYSFELQFQTLASQDAKNKKIPLYEEARSLSTSASRKQELEKLMEKLANDIPTPKNVYDIKTH